MKTSSESDKKQKVSRRLLTERETAKYLAVSPSYLRNARCYGDREGGRPGPPYIKMGDTPKAGIRYSLRDLVAWLEERKQAPRRFPSAGGIKPTKGIAHERRDMPCRAFYAPFH